MKLGSEPCTGGTWGHYFVCVVEFTGTPGLHPLDASVLPSLLPKPGTRCPSICSQGPKFPSVWILMLGLLISPEFQGMWPHLLVGAVRPWPYARGTRSICPSTKGEPALCTDLTLVRCRETQRQLVPLGWLPRCKSTLAGFVSARISLCVRLRPGPIPCPFPCPCPLSLFLH